jgi:hypothetical protein
MAQDLTHACRSLTPGSRLLIPTLFNQDEPGAAWGWRLHLVTGVEDLQVLVQGLPSEGERTDTNKTMLILHSLYAHAYYTYYVPWPGMRVFYCFAFGSNSVLCWFSLLTMLGISVV